MTRARSTTAPTSRPRSGSSSQTFSRWSQRSRAAIWRRRRSPTRRPVRTTSGSSRWPSRSTASRPRRDIDARADDGSPRPSSPVSTGSNTGCGAWVASPGSRRSPTSWWPMSPSCRSSTTGLHYQPAELANGAVELLDEVSKSKITGEEERYSHIDLLDFQANVEGSEQAFANLQPALAKIDSTLTDTISSRFAALDTLLDKYRDKSQPSGFVLVHRADPRRCHRDGPVGAGRRRAVVAAWRARSSTRDRRAARIRAQPAPFPRRRAGRRGRGCGWGCRVRRRAGDRTQRRVVGLGPGAVLRRAPGGHRDACAGPARVRGVRHHDHRRPAPCRPCSARGPRPRPG